MYFMDGPLAIVPRKVQVRSAECLIEDRQKSNAVACALLKDGLC